MTVFPSNVKDQHDPQLVLFQAATALAPPMLGNVGKELKVGNLDTRPFRPLLQATELRLPSGLSYVLSKVTLAVKGVGVGLGAVVLGSAATKRGRASERRVNACILVFLNLRL